MNRITNHLKLISRHKREVAFLSLFKRNQILRGLARAIQRNRKMILSANLKDLKKMGDNSVWRDRLLLTPKRLDDIVRSLLVTARLPDPLHKVLETRKLASGLLARKVTIPLGVVGVIYESRPNVTIDLAALAIKSGNAVVLKGGKESYETNRVLVKLIHQVLAKFGIPREVAYLIDPASDWKKSLFVAQGLVDVLIPRGSQALIDFVRIHSTIPVIETGAGVCHTFVDEKFALEDAVRIIVDAKTQRPTICNSLDTLVIHQKAIPILLTALAPQLAKFGVEILADKLAFRVLKNFYPADLLRPSKPADYGREFLSLRMSIKTVRRFKDGLKFVQTMTSGHSEAILTKNKLHAQEFLRTVDAAVVYHNTSTRFTDGGEFGMGSEVGISTQKLHVRGPMGPEALTSYKWVVLGKGQIRK